MLLLLDNAADSAQVRPLLPPTGCAVMVTSTTEMSEELVMLDKALKKLAAVDERKALVVEYRYFGGFTIGEADLLGISSATVERELRFARSWLRREMT